MELDDIAQFDDVMRRDQINFLKLPEGFFLGKIGRLLPLPGNDFSALEHFSIRKTRDGAKHAVIFVNGFLSQGEEDTSDWTNTTRRYFGKATWYHLDWEATRNPTKALASDFRQFLRKIIVPTFPPNLGPTTTLPTSILNAASAWHLSMKNAEIAGRLLANLIARTPGWRFTLAGHSLGARVIHFALKKLAEQPRKRIENAYLLGAAVGGGAKDDNCWNQAADAVRGHIFNCFSEKDMVLANAYRGANAMLSQPAGYRGVHLIHDKIFDFNCTALVNGHLEWKSQFGEIIRQIKEHKG
ncbi:MAG: DUF726 domain-containing protein [Telluria sp.]